MLWNFLAAVGVIVVFFGLIAFMDKPSAKEPKLALDNPSGRPPPTKRYLPEKPKRPLKPSKLPKAPTIPAPEFKSLHGPSKLPQLRTPTH